MSIFIFDYFCVITNIRKLSARVVQWSLTMCECLFEPKNLIRTYVYFFMKSSMPGEKKDAEGKILADTLCRTWEPGNANLQRLQKVPFSVGMFRLGLWGWPCSRCRTPGGGQWGRIWLVVHSPGNKQLNSMNMSNSIIKNTNIRYGDTCLQWLLKIICEKRFDI